MNMHFNKRLPILLITLAAVFWFFHGSIRVSLELAGVKTATLSPSNIDLPVRWPELPWNGPSKETRYNFRHEDGNHVHLYFVEDGVSEKVVGDMPPITEGGIPPVEIRGFLDVTSSSGVVTYASYARYEPYFMGVGSYLADSGLYVFRGNRIRRLLSNIDPAGMRSLDSRISIGGYLDQRGNLYILRVDRMLCVIRDGHIVAKVDVSRMAPSPTIPSMFSDKDNTYFLVPKQFDGENSMIINGADDVQAQYKVEF